MDTKALDLNLLTVLNALLAQDSVSSAARSLRLSQPATSAALARLRKVLDDPLLVRRGNAMVRTARAEELKPRVTALIEEISELFLEPNAFDPSTSTRHFRILANDYAASDILPWLAADLRQSAPGIVLEVLPFDRDYADRFAAREADLALGDSHSLHGYRHCQILATEHYLSAVRADHPRLTNEKVSLDAYLAEEHALVSNKGAVPGVVDKALSELGLSRRVVLTLPYFASVPTVLTRTDLIITVPAGTARGYCRTHGVRVFEPPIKIATFDVVLAWAARSVADPATQWVRERLTAATVQSSS